MFSVRDFEPADQPTVRALLQDGLQSRWGADFDPDANPDTDDLWQHYVVPGGEIVVVEEGVNLVGTGILVSEPESLSDGQTLRLLRISVSLAHHRRGIGRIVVEELVQRAAARGAAKVVVSTDTPWTDAIALYKSCGFVPTSRNDEETHLSRAL